MYSNRFPPLIKQGWLRAILLLLAFILISSLVATASKTILTGFIASTPPTKEQETTLTIISLFISSLAAILLTVIFRRGLDRQPVKSMGFTGRGFQRQAIAGLLGAPVILAACTAILMATGNLAYAGMHVKPGHLLTALILMAVIAFTEEMVFRGYMLNNLLQSMHKWPALLSSAVLFMVAHGSNPGITGVANMNLLLAGLVLGINYSYTRNLWFAICFHFSWNFFQGPVLGHEVSGLALQSILQPVIKGPEWLTGGTFGLEGSVITTGLLLVTLLGLYAFYKKTSR